MMGQEPENGSQGLKLGPISSQVNITDHKAGEPLQRQKSAFLTTSFMGILAFL